MKHHLPTCHGDDCRCDDESEPTDRAELEAMHGDYLRDEMRDRKWEMEQKEKAKP